MKIVEIKKEQEFSISGNFIIRNIKGKQYFLSESKSQHKRLLEFIAVFVNL